MRTVLGLLRESQGQSVLAPGRGAAWAHAPLPPAARWGAGAALALGAGEAPRPGGAGRTERPVAPWWSSG